MLATWVRFAFSQGWVCIRSHVSGSGHEAHDKHAQSTYRPTLEECLAWADGPPGGNVEVLLHESNLFQVDAEAGAPEPWGQPEAHGTIIAKSASLGLHAIYARPTDVPKRRWIKPVPLVDLLSKGVWPLPGCRREGGKGPGEWTALADPCEPAPLPDWIRAAIPVSRTRSPKPVAVTTSSAWGRAALRSEAELLSAVPEGGVNEALNVAAFKIGKRLHSGQLDQAEAEETLVQACVRPGFDERKTRDTCHRAMEAGKRDPTGPTPPPLVEFVQHVEAIPHTPTVIPESISHVEREVLTPGAHRTSEDQYVEQPMGRFAAGVLEAIPPGTLYRRDTVPGFVIGARFHPASVSTILRLCDRPNVRLVKWVKQRTGEQVKVYEQCSAPQAGCILDAAAHALPEIKLLTGYPVVLADGTIARPGFNVGGVYYAGPLIEPETDPKAIRAHLLDLITDYPFEDDASRANCIGMLLTPMIRPMVGKVPLHLVTSPMPGTGKTRLVEQTLGISYLAEELSSSQLPEKPEDRAKWLIALLIGGDTLVHLDNLTPELDSANLASLLTSARISDRLLGASTFLRLENQLTIAATGNNTQLSSELARRTVVVRLSHPDPEHRSGWKHPDSAGYAREQRTRTLACLAGLAMLADVEWGGQTLGSFEVWSLAVASALAAVGIDGHLGNRARYREESDSEDASLTPLVAAWAREHEHNPVTASMLAVLPEASQAAEGVARLGRLLARLRDRRFQIETGIFATVVRGGWTATRRPAYYLSIAGSYPRIAGTTVATRDDITVEYTT